MLRVNGSSLTELVGNTKMKAESLTQSAAKLQEDATKQRQAANKEFNEAMAAATKQRDAVLVEVNKTEFQANEQVKTATKLKEVLKKF